MLLPQPSDFPKSTARHEIESLNPVPYAPSWQLPQTYLEQGLQLLPSRAFTAFPYP